MVWKTFGAFSHVHPPLFCRTEVTVHHVSDDLIPTWKCLWECSPGVRSSCDQGRKEERVTGSPLVAGLAYPRRCSSVCCILLPALTRSLSSWVTSARERRMTQLGTEVCVREGLLISAWGMRLSWLAVLRSSVAGMQFVQCLWLLLGEMKERPFARRG